MTHWAIEAYERLKWAEANRPSDDKMVAWQAERDREDRAAKIRRRLPKVA